MYNKRIVGTILFSCMGDVMVITDICDNPKNKYLKCVFVDGAFSFHLPVNFLKRFSYQVGDMIEQSVIDHYKTDVMLPRVKKKALDYLLRRPYAQQELKNKLVNYGFSEGDSNLVVEYLLDLHYLNDEEYTRRYVHDAVLLKKMSLKRIRYDLFKKGIDEQIIEKYIEEFSDEEADTLRNSVKRKMDKILDDSPKSIDKVRGYFFRKGYNLSQINAAIKEVQVRSEEDE